MMPRPMLHKHRDRSYDQQRKQKQAHENVFEKVEEVFGFAHLTTPSSAELRRPTYEPQSFSWSSLQ
jgi:hypothetical protein